MSWNFLATIISSALSKAEDLDKAFAGKGKGRGLIKVFLIIVIFFLLPIILLISLCKWLLNIIDNSTKTNPLQKTNKSTTAQSSNQTSQASNVTASEVPTLNESSNDDELICVDLAEVAENPDNRVVQLVGEWVKQEEVTLLCANRGAGKSTAAVQLALELATGEYSKLFGVKLGPKQDCVYLSYEMSQAQWGERYQGGVEELRGRVKMVFPKTRTIDAALDCCRQLCDSYQKTGARHIAIFVDNLGCIVENANNPSYKDVKTLIDGLRALMNKYRSMGMTVTPLVVVHTTKEGDTPRGSGVLENTSDATITITLRDVEAKVCDIALTRSRSGATPLPFAARLVSEPYLHFEPAEIPFSQPDSVLADKEAEGRQSLLERAKYLASDKGKGELNKLKAELGSEDHYANMPEEQKAELVTLAKTLVNERYSFRLTSAIILLEKGKYISHDAISKCCKV